MIIISLPSLSFWQQVPFWPSRKHWMATLPFWLASFLPLLSLLHAMGTSLVATCARLSASFLVPSTCTSTPSPWLDSWAGDLSEMHICHSCYRYLLARQWPYEALLNQHGSRSWPINALNLRHRAQSRFPAQRLESWQASPYPSRGPSALPSSAACSSCSSGAYLPSFC